jgi:sporulation protein YlmC with PRC-barrel domain
MNAQIMNACARPARVLSLAASFIWIQLVCVAVLNASSFAQSAQYKAPPRQSEQRNPALPPAPLARSMSDWRAGKLIGATLTDTLGNSIGTIQDIVIDGDGKVVAVLVSVGGVLGLGESVVPIALRHLTISSFDAETLEVKTSLSREAIEQSAQFGAEGPPATPMEREAR